MSKKKYKRLPKPIPWGGGEKFWPRSQPALMTREMMEVRRDQMAYERIVKEMLERQNASD